MYYLWFIISILLFFITGNAVLKLIDHKYRYHNTIERVVISYFLGVGIVALIQLYAMCCRIPLTKTNILLLLLPFFIVQAYFCVTKKNIVFKSKSISHRIGQIGLHGKEAVLTVYLVLLCLIMLFACLSFPIYSYDARAVWSFKAKIIFYQHSVFNDDFLDQYRFHPNTAYPLLMPLCQSFIYNILGSVDEYLVKILFALFYISLVLFIYHTQRDFFSLGRLHSLIFTAVSVSVPFLFVIFSGSVPSAYIDFPFACFYTFTVVYLLKYLREHNLVHIIIAALSAAFCIFIKNEGGVLFLISLAIFIGEKKVAKGFIIYLLLPIALTLPWFWLRAKFPVIYDSNPLHFLTFTNVMQGFPRFGLVMKLTLREMFLNLRSWGLLWVIIFFSVALSFKKDCYSHINRREYYLCVIPFFYYFIVVTFIYMFFAPLKVPTEIEFSGTSFERLRSHTLFLLMLFISLQISAFFRKKETAD